MARRWREKRYPCDDGGEIVEYASEPAPPKPKKLEPIDLFHGILKPDLVEEEDNGRDNS